MSGSLSKMKIQGFKNLNHQDSTGPEFEVQINPETYSLSHSVKMAKELPQTGGSSTSIVHGLPPRKLSFEIVFDATGALGDGRQSEFGIEPHIEQFLDAVYRLEGDTTRPPYVWLKWGGLAIDCQLENLELSHKLFNAAGYSLRATAKVSFEEVISDATAEKKLSGKASLTQVRTVKAGDSLPLLCQQIYRDPTLYTKVAAANQLTNLRSLQVGQQLLFPPLVAAAKKVFR